MKGFKVKKALHTDAEAIHLINKECLPVYYSVMEFYNMINSKDYLVLMVKNNKQNKVVGYLTSQFQYGRCHIMSFGVSKDYRENGFGKMLIDKLIELVGNRSIYLSLYVHIENDIAISFYKKNNFEIKEETVNYYQIPIEGYKSQNAYFMIRKIN